MNYELKLLKGSKPIVLIAWIAFALTQLWNAAQISAGCFIKIFFIVLIGYCFFVYVFRWEETRVRRKIRAERKHHAYQNREQPCIR